MGKVPPRKAREKCSLPQSWNNIFHLELQFFRFNDRKAVRTVWPQIRAQYICFIFRKKYEEASSFKKNVLQSVFKLCI